MKKPMHNFLKTNYIKMKKIFLSIFIISISMRLNAQTEWVIKESRNFDYIVTTEIKGLKIIGYTRRNALKDYVGSFKYTLAKTITPLKYPEIVHFDGAFKDDTKTAFTGKFHYLTSEKKMEGILSNDTIKLTLFNPKTQKSEQLIGIKKTMNTVQVNYTEVVNKIINLTEEKIYSPKILSSNKWQNFKTALLNNSSKMKDNFELQIGFLAIARDFPFSHYYISKHKTGIDASNNVNLIEQNSKTVVLEIKAFEGKREQMDSIIRILDSKHYGNLIIDLRNNGGGDVETAIPLMEFIESKETIVGIFPNSKWYKEHDRFPTRDEYAKFNEFNTGTLDAFYQKAEAGYGVFLKCMPSKSHFKGNVFVLTNKNTGSTSEVVASALQENKLATIVGQKTAGAVLSAKVFNLNADFDILIPQNDYISYAGNRLDKKGVKPDIIVKGADEVEYILKNLIK
jgi:Peptidase family S41